jgi:uncharacterized phage protein gp47/JayE
MADFNIPPIPVPIIDQYGLTLPVLDDIYNWMKDAYRTIYGADIYIEPDSQDGQLIGIMTKAFHDYVSVIDAVYQAFSPSTAQGVGLSRVVKINGIRRHVSTRSQVDLRIVGRPGTVILNGGVTDVLGNVWALPVSVVIPPSAELIVRAICDTDGAIEAAAHTVSIIKNAIKGWQTADNPEPAIVGMPVEIDSQLRVRQSLSTEIPSRSLLEGMIGAVAAVPGVFRFRGYENESFGINEYGMPAHSFVMVVDGGDPAVIAEVIRLKKAPGVITWGTSEVMATDEVGIPHSIKFSRSRDVPIRVTIPIRPKGNYTTLIDSQMRTTVSDWINALPPGGNIILSQLLTVATLNNHPAYEIERPVTIGRFIEADTFEADLLLDFDEHPSCTPDNIFVSQVTTPRVLT